MPPKALSKIFDSVNFHYPKEAPDYKEVTRLINSHGGNVVRFPELAHRKLLPSKWAEKYPEGDFYDISLLGDSVGLGKFPNEDDLERYVVNHVVPIPQAEKDKQKAQQKRRRSISPSSASPSGRRVVVEAQLTASQEERQARLSLPPIQLPQPQEVPTTDPFHILFHGRTYYQEEDDMKIIDYVEAGLSKPGYSANGQKFWKQAVNIGLIPGKTWQSLEGRWKKSIKPRWNDFFEPKYRAWKALQAPPIVRKRR